MTIQESSLHYSTSSLFTVRIWKEASGEVRIQVTHVLSGDTRYFRDWAEMLAFLQAAVQQSLQDS
jgi:hypothetical protein